jgi:hypothetical protein
MGWRATVAERKFIFSMDVDWIPGSHTGLLALYDFCDRQEMKGTFFIAGRFAREYPDIVREAASRGHDVGTHGWEHGQDPTEEFRSRSREEQRRWLRLSTDAVGDATGRTPAAFRAPHLWVGETLLELLEEAGYLYDSSVPARRFDCGIGQVSSVRHFFAPLVPYHPARHDFSRRGESPILEIPPSSFIVPLNMSALRKLGLRALKWAARRVAARTSTLVFYGHPSEFVAPGDQELPTATPRRHQRNIGPHNFELLGRFVDYVVALGFEPARISEIQSPGPGISTLSPLPMVWETLHLGRPLGASKQVPP